MACSRGLLATSLIVVAISFGFSSVSVACPFCNAVKPTLAQARDAAAAAFIAEAGPMENAEGGKQKFLLHTVLAASKKMRNADALSVTTDGPLKEGTLALLLGSGAADAAPNELQWTAVALDEASCAYVVRAPTLRTPPSKRLAYFAKFLEHPNPVIAEDAFLEFAHASFDETVQAVPSLRMNELRAWLVDKNVPPERKGFYGLALGLATTPEDRQQNEALLHGQIVAPAVDFRAGFDGILGGYLLLTGSRGLDLLETRYLANPLAANGDVRHAMRALRFYHEYGRGVPPLRQSEALAHVLDRPEFAAEAITDLARWQYWPLLNRLKDLYARKDYSDPLIHRAIVGYLRFCPKPEAATALDHLRQIDPPGVAEANQYWDVFSTGR